MRQAESEEATLGQRLKQAEVSANHRLCARQFEEFRKQLRNSVAVIATSPNKAHALLSDTSEAYTTFYRVVRSGTRSPRTNWYDQVRGIADELLFPNYRDYISFAALSLNGVGCWYCGSVHLVLADFAIRERASVFEENSLLFCQKHGLGVHKPVPAGYRARWEKRDELATAKLEPLLNAATTVEEFPRILLSRTDEVDADLVEVHIYERLNRDSIQRVVLRAGGSEDDEIMKLLIRRDCRRFGIPFEEV